MNRIKELRLARGLTTRDLAELVETTANTISRWERELRIPHPKVRLRLATALGQSVEYVFPDTFPSAQGEKEQDPQGDADPTAVEADAVDPGIADDLIDEPDSTLPTAQFRGVLHLLDITIPCYVLSDGQRVIGRTSTTEMLTGVKGGGGLEKYLGTEALKPFINMDVTLERMVAFRLPEVAGLNRAVKGLPADLLIDICQGLVAALDANSRPGSPASQRMTPRQMQLAIKAGMFLAACAKVGLDAMIDEATGYQYERAEDALKIKLNAYLADEMRKWEKAFPDDLWIEFQRLTGWRGPLHSRPKYWGKLVTELVYQYLDPDVAKWLKEHVPSPEKGRNYHQWLSGQYGLKKLVEHLWMLIGVAKTCVTMTELRDRMAELNGKQAVQLRLYFPRQDIKGKG